MKAPSISLDPAPLPRLGEARPPEGLAIYLETGPCRLAGAALSVAAVVGMNLAWPGFFRAAPFLLYLMAVAIASRLGGLCCGLTAAALGGIATAALNMRGVPPGARGDATGLAGFVAAAGLVSYLNGRLREQYRRLVERETRFRLALESAPSAMLLARPEGRIVLANGNASRLFGFGSEELLRMGVDELMPDALGPRSNPPSHGHVREIEARRKDGSSIPVELRIVPIRADEGELLMAFAMDISERRRAHEELRRLNAALGQRVADLEEFSHTIAHDLRAPLRAVGGYARILSRRLSGRVAGEDGALLERIARAVEGMDRLILDVLAFSRAANEPVEMAPVDIEPLLREIMARYPRVWEAVVEARAPLGRVLGNEALLTQVLGNLLDNALKFVPEGRQPRVKITSRRGGGRLRVTVRDNGVGIAPEYHERIFRPFERGPRQLDREGSGIGLAIVRKAVERMNGTVGVESRPGEGSAFWFELPEAAG